MNSSGGKVAVVGMACRFPGGADSPDALWGLLDRGEDAIGPMPPGRFDIQRFVHPEPRTPGKIVTAEGGFLEGVDRFDAAFFGISPREARKIDPQQRLLLELAWEALEDGAIVPSSLAGSRTGVYAGLWTSDYETVMARQIDDIDLYSTTGGGRYSAAGRVSFAFDLRGPSMTVDTACSTSLVALHLGCQALRTGEADLVLAGAANLILQPYVSIGYSRSGMLSPGAHCRFGAPSPDGYVRSEGAAMVALKPLEAALRDRNPIHAVILGSCVNSDGRGSGSLVAPSEDAQADMLRAAYENAGVLPGDLAYVEAHGTGTAAGDRVELGALASVLGRRERPVPVGSIKTTIGHTEAASGLAGLIRAILVLRHRRVPPSRTSSELNPEIPWSELGLELPVRTTRLEGGADSLIAGVNSFGVSGTNSHIVISGPLVSADRTTDAEVEPGRTARIVTLSAATPDALDESARNLRRFLWHSEQPDGPTLEDLSYTTTCRREHLRHRLALVTDSTAAISAALDDHLETRGSPAIRQGAPEPTRRPRTAFVFSGQGSQWVGMGRELLEAESVFAETLRACDDALSEVADFSLISVLEGHGPDLEAVDVIQPTLVAVQIALARQLEAWGIRPSAVVGHSMGEVAAAHVAGGLSLQDAMKVIATRSRLLSEIAGRGAMGLVDMDRESLGRRLEGRDDVLSVAAVNGPRSTVLSGDPDALDAFLAELEADDVFCRRVRVDVASHSPQCDPLLPRLEKELDGLAPSAPEVPFYSTPLAREIREVLDGAYWVKNLRGTVRLDETVRAMVDDGIDTFVEISPHPILLSSLADIAASADGSLETVGLLRREEPELHRLLEGVAGLHLLGVDVDWEALAPPSAQPVRLPGYPWQRERHWLDRWEDWSGDERGAPTEGWPDEARSWLYGLEWEDAEGPPPGTAGGPGEHWVLVARPTDRAAAIERTLRARGWSVVRTAPNGTSEMREALGGGRPPDGVVVLAEPGPESHRYDTALAHCDSVRRLARIVLDGAGQPPRLVLATVGSWQVDDELSGELHPTGAGLWGMGRVLRHEQPELGVRLLDLDPGASADATASVLAAVVSDRSLDHDLAVRNGVYRSPRLVRLDPPPVEAERPRWPTRGATLVTGGLGDLGRRVAGHLVDGGCGPLILLSRTPLPPRTEWDALDPESREGVRVGAVRDLESRGASVHVRSVDVGDAGALEGFLEAWRAEARPEIVAVVHAAGTLDGHLVRDLSEDALRRVFHGKVGGAFHLDHAFPDAERFVLFSSTAAILPQAGEANYAAANAILDALAESRTSRGRDALSVNWGVWTDSGLIADARGARYVDGLTRQGIGTMPPDTAIRVFGRLARSSTSRILVAPVDWQAFAETRGADGRSSLFSRLVGDTAAGTDSARARIESLPPAERPEKVRSEIRRILGTVLDVSPSDLQAGTTFGAQGMDSLMAMEFRNHLEGAFDLNVSATVAWNYPTLELLTGYVLERLEAESDEERVASPADLEPVEAPDESMPPGGGTEGLARHFDEVSTMSDDEALRELLGDR